METKQCKTNWAFLEDFFGFDPFCPDKMLPKKWCFTGNEIKTGKYHVLQLRFCQNFQHSRELKGDQALVAALIQITS